MRNFFICILMKYKMDRKFSWKCFVLIKLWSYKIILSRHCWHVQLVSGNQNLRKNYKIPAFSNLTSTQFAEECRAEGSSPASAVNAQIVRNMILAIKEKRHKEYLKLSLRKWQPPGLNTWYFQHYTWPRDIFLQG